MISSSPLEASAVANAGKSTRMARGNPRWENAPMPIEAGENSR
jgi:hypothetical protein